MSRLPFRVLATVAALFVMAVGCAGATPPGEIAPAAASPVPVPMASNEYGSAGHLIERLHDRVPATAEVPDADWIALADKSCPYFLTPGGEDTVRAQLSGAYRGYLPDDQVRMIGNAFRAYCLR